MTVFTRTWWEAAGSRAAYTALAALSGLVLLFLAGEVTITYVLSFTAVALLASLTTSLVGLPEVKDGAVPLWRAVTVRVLKTAAQVAAPALAAVTLLHEIGWQDLGVQVAGAALTTLIRTLMAYLPEAEDPSVAELVDGAYQITTLTEGDRSELRLLRSALDEGDPSRAAIEKVLHPNA